MVFDLFGRSVSEKDGPYERYTADEGHAVMRGNAAEVEDAER